MVELIFLGFIFCMVFWAYKVVKWVVNRFKKYPEGNAYIDAHKKKVKDDISYTRYLEWCKENSQMAMDKKGFEEIRDNEKALFKKFEKIGIS